MAILTWRNVAAPDLSNASQAGIRTAADLFNRAAQSAQGVTGTIQAHQDDVEKTKTAMADRLISQQMFSVDDPEQYKQMLTNGTMGQLARQDASLAQLSAMDKRQDLLFQRTDEQFKREGLEYDRDRDQLFDTIRDAARNEVAQGAVVARTDLKKALGMIPQDLPEEDQIRIGNYYRSLFKEEDPTKWLRYRQLKGQLEDREIQNKALKLWDDIQGMGFSTQEWMKRFNKETDPRVKAMALNIGKSYGQDLYGMVYNPQSNFGIQDLNPGDAFIGDYTIGRKNVKGIPFGPVENPTGGQPDPKLFESTEFVGLNAKNMDWSKVPAHKREVMQDVLAYKALPDNYMPGTQQVIGQLNNRITTLPTPAKIALNMDQFSGETQATIAQRIAAQIPPGPGGEKADWGRIMRLMDKVKEKNEGRETRIPLTDAVIGGLIMESLQSDRWYNWSNVSDSLDLVQGKLDKFVNDYRAVPGQVKHYRKAQGLQMELEKLQQQHAALAQQAAGQLEQSKNRANAGTGAIDSVWKLQEISDRIAETQKALSDSLLVIDALPEPKPEPEDQPDPKIAEMRKAAILAGKMGPLGN